MWFAKGFIKGEWVTLAQCRDVDLRWLRRDLKGIAERNECVIYFVHHDPDDWKHKWSKNFVARTVDDTITPTTPRKKSRRDSGPQFPGFASPAT